MWHLWKNFSIRVFHLYTKEMPYIKYLFLWNYEREVLKKFWILCTILIFLPLISCDTTETNEHDGHLGHNGHFHNSPINHNHSATYNTPCENSHGHCLWMQNVSIAELLENIRYWKNCLFYKQIFKLNLFTLGDSLFQAVSG